MGDKAVRCSHCGQIVLSDAKQEPLFEAPQSLPPVERRQFAPEALYSAQSESEHGNRFRR